MTYNEFAQKQAMPYEQKIIHAERRAWEFYEKMTGEGKGCHVSVGGLDSITLLMFLRRIGINIPAISVSCLEDKSIQAIHKQLGVEPLAPCKSKAEVTRECGIPLISKGIAKKIRCIQNPTQKNEDTRRAAMTGIKADGTYSKYMHLPKKWLRLFGGPEDEQYQTAPVRVSDECCYWMKEKPLDDWAREHNGVPYQGLMFSEGGRRQRQLIKNGCNHYGKGTTRSCPFALFERQDLLQLALDLHVPVPSAYGAIERGENGTLCTTKAQRTGCSMCGFGVHLEKRPHRFDRLREDNPKEWAFWMYGMGWGEALTYIGVGWEDRI